MAILTIRHLTRYRYDQAVAFGAHRLMLRPRESYDQRVLDFHLAITPEPAELRHTHDVFGNCVSIARFEGRAQELEFESRVRLERTGDEGFESPQDDASGFPILYSAEDMPDLARSIERHFPDPERRLEAWAHRFVGKTSAFELLANMAQAIHGDFTYMARHERGTQTPLETLERGRGTCRDFAILMMEAARTLGFAVRFVSGYLHTPDRNAEPLKFRGGGNTHAWVRIYMPGGGWAEFDPTNGIIGNLNLVRVAVTRDALQAVPLCGTWLGFPGAYLGMDVEVDVQEDGTAQKPKRAGAL